MIVPHTEEWTRNKLKYLGANDIACLLNNGYSDREEIIYYKSNNKQRNFTEKTLEILKKGLRYEPLVRELCAIRNKIIIDDIGQQFHPDHRFITATPDGIIRSDSTLVEFKVRSHINYDVPFKYWIQMQIQMEVFDIDSCKFCDNQIYEYPNRDEYLKDSGSRKPRGEIIEEGIHYYWKLETYYETTVHRNKKWFAMVLPDITKSWNLIQHGRDTKFNPELAPEYNRIMNFYSNHQSMITQYNITHCILKDPLLSWLDQHGRMSDRDKPEGRFSLTRYIYNKTISFQQKIKEYIKKRTPEKMYLDIDQQYHPHTQPEKYKINYNNQLLYYDRFIRTQQAIKAKIPIIFNAGLYDNDRMLYGKADILILVKYIDDFLHVPSVFSEKEQQHYVIINTKFGTLDLRSNGMHLLTSPKQNVYKGHLTFLNMCLAKMQNFTCTKGLLICRKSNYTASSKKHKFDNCFSRIGVVDFTGIDKTYIKQVEDAIDWIRVVRSSSATILDPFKPSRFELYPNMKNKRDHPWHNYKLKLAEHLSEITRMYKCGLRQKIYSRDLGITNWKKLDEDTLVTSGKKTIQQITTIIKANKKHKGLNLDQVEAHSTKLPDDIDLVLNMPVIEYFVDFESANSLADNFTKFPQASGSGMIYMIGSLCVNNVSKQKTHKTYIVDRLNPTCEKQIVTQWLNDLLASTEGKTKNIYIYHWGNAEKYLLEKAMKQHNIVIGNLILVDLCKAFRESYVALPGSYSYSIKEIGRSLFRLGKIETIWSTDEIDGSSAMVAAWKAEEICRRENTKFKRIPFITDMIQYNYVDCKVMEEIMSYLRTLYI